MAQDGDVELYTSIDGILRAVPSMNWDWAATWSRLAIMRVHLFLDRTSYDRGGIERSYASKARGALRGPFPACARSFPKAQTSSWPSNGGASG